MSGDYIVFWQQIGHATENDAWWISKIETFAGDKTTDHPETQYEDDIEGTVVVPAWTETHWNIHWVGGTTANDKQYEKGGNHYKIAVFSNYLEKETRPNGDIISSQSVFNTVSSNEKATNAGIQGLLSGESPFRGGVAIANGEIEDELINNQSFTITPPDEL
jgi:hypothetical protein